MITVIGDYITDQYIYGTVERISPELPIPIFKESHYEYRPGGAGNVIANLKALGETVKEHTSYNSCKKRFVCDNHILFRSDIDNYVANERFDFYVGDSVYCIISDYGKGFIHYSQEIVNHCLSQGCEVIVDPKKTLDNYKNASIVKLNKQELHNFGLGLTTTQLRARFNIGTIIVTMGKDGLMIDSEEFFGTIPTTEHQVSDVTGAGDIFIAALAHFLNVGNNLYDACVKANKLASISVTKFGTYVLTPKDIAQTKIVFTNGCFDILHRGHIEYLKKSKELGYKLIVGLNSDASIKRLKGNDRPVNNQQDRKTVLESLEFVDEVIVFDEDTPYELIKSIKPDIITKGGDYKSKNEVVGNDLAEVVLIPFVEGYSTTSVLEKVSVRND
jgi:D-beta-D-heptose 7-phosphate kinase/D-beta-D-heptose 1-phosphate adenosyltransferase